MARVKKKSVATTGKELQSWDQELEGYAQNAIDKESGTGGGNYISTKNGNFTYKGDNIESPIPAVVLDSILDYAYYTTTYDDDKPTSPACFAIGIDEKTMQPHSDCAEPQSDLCHTCWANKYKSDDRGKGKACKNQRRLAVVNAEVLEDIDENAEIAMLRVSPTSLKYWSGYVKKIGTVLRRPPFAVVTEISIEPEKSYHILKFNLRSKIPDGMLGTMKKLMDQCQNDLSAGYPAFEEEIEEAPKKKLSRKATPKKKQVVKKKRKF